MINAAWISMQPICVGTTKHGKEVGQWTLAFRMCALMIDFGRCTVLSEPTFQVHDHIVAVCAIPFAFTDSRLPKYWTPTIAG
jgi:hypothetical protein